MLKLLVIQQSPDIGGAEIFMNNLIREFRGFGVKIFSYTDSPKLNWKGKIPFTLDIIGNLKGLIKTLVLLPWAGFWYSRLLYRLRKEVDLILMSGFSEKLLVSCIAFLFGLPVIWIEYGPLTPVFKKNFYLPKICYQLVKGLPKLIIVPSENTRRSLLKEAGISLRKMKVIPCGVPEKKIRLRKREKRVVGCLSRLAKEKGQEYLVRAIPLVSKEIPDVELWIGGKGPDEKRLKLLTRKLGIEKKVKFLGFVKDKWKIFSQLNVFVFPTVWKLEGFGLVTAEAMMAGLPVVATKIGPNPELVVEGETGILVEPANPEQLAQAIIGLLKNPKKAKKMGLKGHKRARRFFSLEKVVKKYDQSFFCYYR